MRNKDDNIHKSVAYDIVLYCPRNQYTKNQINRIIRSYKNLLLKIKKICLKWTHGHSGNYNRVAMLSKLYLTTTEITMENLKSIGRA